MDKMTEATDAVLETAMEQLEEAFKNRLALLRQGGQEVLKGNDFPPDIAEGLKNADLVVEQAFHDVCFVAKWSPLSHEERRF